MFKSNSLTISLIAAVAEWGAESPFTAASCRTGDQIWTPMISILAKLVCRLCESPNPCCCVCCPPALTPCGLLQEGDESIRFKRQPRAAPVDIVPDIEAIGYVASSWQGGGAEAEPEPEAS